MIQNLAFLVALTYWKRTPPSMGPESRLVGVGLKDMMASDVWGVLVL
jgi:hypothetical protein